DPPLPHVQWSNHRPARADARRSPRDGGAQAREGAGRRARLHARDLTRALWAQRIGGQERLRRARQRGGRQHRARVGERAMTRVRQRKPFAFFFAVLASMTLVSTARADDEEEARNAIRRGFAASALGDTEGALREYESAKKLAPKANAPYRYAAEA